MDGKKEAKPHELLGKVQSKTLDELHSDIHAKPRFGQKLPDLKEKWVRFEDYQKFEVALEQKTAELAEKNAKIGVLKGDLNFARGDVKRFKGELEGLRSKIGEIIDSFDVVDFLERHNIKYDEWLKSQFFQLLEEVKKEIGEGEEPEK